MSKEEERVEFDKKEVVKAEVGDKENRPESSKPTRMNRTARRRIKFAGMKIRSDSFIIAL